MQWLKNSGAQREKRQASSSFRAQDDFKRAKAHFERCSGTNADAGKLAEAKKNLFLSAEVLTDIAQKRNLESRYRLSLDRYKAQLGLMRLAVKACDYFTIPFALYLSFKLRGTHGSSEAATMGLQATAAAFIFRAFGFRFNNKMTEEQHGKLDALLEAKKIAGNKDFAG